MNQYSILVNSCDAYSDAWTMFFFLLKKNWQDLGGGIPRVYLNCETLQYHDDEIEIINLNHYNTLAWGDRLLKCLEEIDDEFILMMCEDFYYEDAIKTEIIDKCVGYMLADKTILTKIQNYLTQMSKSIQVLLRKGNLLISSYQLFQVYGENLN